MTHDEAKYRVDGIKNLAGHQEAAYRAEDQLYRDFVVFVATQAGPHQATAAEIVKTDEIKFSRW
jgi:hypothetical protein